MAEKGVLTFTLAGPDGVRQRFDFDYSAEKLTGEQSEFIRERTGMPAITWLRRAQHFDIETFDERDLLVIAFLAAYRKNELLEWRHFIKTVSPFTVDTVDDEDDEDDEDQAADEDEDAEPDPPAAPQEPAPSKPAGRSRSRKARAAT